MNTTKILTVVLAVLAAATVMGSAQAQQDSKPEGGSMIGHSDSGSMMEQKPEGGSMMGQGGMMGRHGMMGGMGGKRGHGSGCGRMTAHIEGRLAFLKAELKITPEQESLWIDYAAAVRDNSKAIGTRCSAMMGQGDDKAPSLPERLDTQEQFMTARLDGLRAVGKALKPLYGALSDEQKQLADQMIRSSTGMM